MVPVWLVGWLVDWLDSLKDCNSNVHSFGSSAAHIAQGMSQLLLLDRLRMLLFWRSCCSRSTPTKVLAALPSCYLRARIRLYTATLVVRGEECRNVCRL